MCRVKATGTEQDLMVETAALIQELYKGISQENTTAAKWYKNNLIGLLLDPKSPVWKEG
jgi:hypothetical protein